MHKHITHTYHIPISPIIIFSSSSIFHGSPPTWLMSTVAGDQTMAVEVGTRKMFSSDLVHGLVDLQETIDFPIYRRLTLPEALDFPIRCIGLFCRFCRSSRKQSVDLGRQSPPILMSWMPHQRMLAHTCTECLPKFSPTAQMVVCRYFRWSRFIYIYICTYICIDHGHSQVHCVLMICLQSVLFDA